MQLKITKTIALAALVMAAAAAQAQFKISKVTNGTRTAIKSGDKVDIQLNGDGTVKNNVVVDLDIAAFKKAYRYDRVSVMYVLDGYDQGAVTHVFDSQLNEKKYQGKGIIPIYIYDTKNFKETDYRVLLGGTVVYNGKPKPAKFVVSGSYITGEEGYFDGNDNYKFRNVYSKEEPLAEIVLNVVFDNEKILNYEYNMAMNGLENLSNAFDRSVTSNITQYVAPYVATPLYNALATGFEEVFKAKVAAVKNETDKQKAVAAFEQLYADFDVMAAVSKKDKNVLKAMNKEIKTKTTVEEKWALIKANA